MSLKAFRLLDTGHLSAAANMALDQVILDEVSRLASPPTLRFLQFRPSAALVGYHQDVSLEVRQDYCARHGIDINRRHTGGGTILFQESALGWEVFGVPGQLPFQGAYEQILTRICTIAAAGLSRLGILAAFRPRNDIEVHGRKISGTGGVSVSGGLMFQGTVLVENEVERFLRALRVPVEKLKKREIESLMERICFLSDLVDPLPSIGLVKEHLTAEFASQLSVEMIPSGLTAREQQRLEEEVAFFASPDWILARSRPRREGEPVRSITQTDAGTMRIHLWFAPGGRRIRQALISGDFFAIPSRLVHDLEAELVGVRAEETPLRDTVARFFRSHDGRLLGIDPPEVADAIAAAAQRLDLLQRRFAPDEANELFLVNLGPRDLPHHRPRWLLLPYCSKNLDCTFRKVPGCDECGLCEIGDCFELARGMNMIPITIQSFEHLMEILSSRCAVENGMYVGSCCEAFYAKHQMEMKQTGARGVLVNLDSTTCYDLGKGSSAYKGDFENKTSLNLNLIAKTLTCLHAYHTPR